MHQKLKDRQDIDWEVLDYIPESKQIKFIVIGDDRAVPFDSKTFDGKQITSTIHLWVEKRGMLDCKRIIGLVEEELADDLEYEGMEFEYHETLLVEVKREDLELVHGTIQLIYRTIEREV